MPVFRDSSSANRTAENGLLDSEGGIFLDFLWRAHAQSDFEEGIGECNAITSRQFGHEELTFASTLETRSATNDMVQ
jgi:hypothetical protein